MKAKRVYVALTPEQIKKLKPVFDAVFSADRKLEPGMALAQLYYDGKSGCMVAAFVDNDQSEKIFTSMSRKFVYTTGSSAIAKSKKG